MLTVVPKKEALEGSTTLVDGLNISFKTKNPCRGKLLANTTITRLEGVGQKTNKKKTRAFQDRIYFPLLKHVGKEENLCH